VPAAEPAGAAPSEKVFDWAAALAGAAGDEQLVRELAGVFLCESPKWLAEMRTAIAEGSPSRLQIAAHTLKGAAGLFAAKPALEAARKLEALGRQGNLSEAEEAWSALEQEVGRLRPALTSIAEPPAWPGRPGEDQTGR
jgi:HPt (histidine-containing phosphotransfer) domain-containing protein